MPTFRKVIFDEPLWLSWWQGGTRYTRNVNVTLPPGCRVVNAYLAGYVTCYIWMTCMSIRWNGEKVYETCWGWGESGRKEIYATLGTISSGTHTVDVDLWKQVWFPRDVDYFLHLELVIEYVGMPPTSVTGEELKRMALIAGTVAVVAIPAAAIGIAAIKKKKEKR